MYFENLPASSASALGPDPLLIALLHLTKDEYYKVVEQLRTSLEKAKSLVYDKKPCRPVEATEEGVVEQRVKKAIASSKGYGEGSIRL